jgi:hypothetical protein
MFQSPRHKLRILPQTPLPFPSKPRKLPRIFLLTYDSSKLHLHRVPSFNKHEQHEAWGTLYPNGLVTLETGVIFESLSEMRQHFEQAGNWRIQWLEAGELREEEPT